MKQLLSPLGFRHFEFNDNGFHSNKYVRENEHNYITISFRDDRIGECHIHISTKNPSFVYEAWHSCNSPDELIASLLHAIDSTKASSTRTITTILASMRNLDDLSLSLHH